MANPSSRDWVSQVRTVLEVTEPHNLPDRPTAPIARTEHGHALGDLLEAVDDVGDAMRDANVGGVAKELTSLIRTAIRAAWLWGIDLREVWDEGQAEAVFALTVEQRERLAGKRGIG
ncbi:MAG: hypothetical protein AB7G11_16100 [Phycisphaerales bacterium]